MKLWVEVITTYTSYLVIWIILCGEINAQIPFHRGQHVDCVYVNPGEFDCDGILFENREEEADVLGTWEWWVDLVACVVLLIVAGLSFGLTMGLMSLDILKTRVLKRSKQEGHEFAKVVHPFIKRHHLLLVQYHYS